MLDPGHPWLYLVGYAFGGPILQVIDRATLAPVTTLAGKGPTQGWMPGIPYPMLSAADRKLYLVDSCPFCGDGDVIYLFTFGLML